MELKLDSKTFKALSSEKRVEMLKLLKERRHTQSEIAGELGLAVPTVKEHLSALVHAGLVEMQDEGRKWKYFALTKSGKSVLAPEETKIWIMLGVFVLSAIGAAYRFFSLGSFSFISEDSLVHSPEPAMDMMAMKSAPVMEAAPEAMMMAQESAVVMAQEMRFTVDGLFLALIIVSFVALLLLFGLYVRQRVHISKLGKSLKKS